MIERFRRQLRRSFRGWCGVEGRLDIWPRRVRKILLTFACNHDITIFPEGGVITRDIEVMPVSLDNPFGTCYDLRCGACKVLVATVRGEHYRFPPIAEGVRL